MRWEVIEEIPTFKVGDFVGCKDGSRVVMRITGIDPVWIRCHWIDSVMRIHVEYYPPGLLVHVP